MAGLQCSGRHYAFIGLLEFPPDENAATAAKVDAGQTLRPEWVECDTVTWMGFYLLRQLGHVDRFDFLEGRQTFQSLARLLLHGDDERILHVAVGRQILSCETKQVAD